MTCRLIFALVCVWILAGCADEPVRQPRPHARTAAPHATESAAPEPRPVRRKPVPQVESLAQLMTAYRTTFDRLGNGADEEMVEGLKDNAGRLFRTDGKALRILTNQDKKSAWFGNTVVFVENSGQAYFIDNKGNSFSEHLKDRILGGTISDDAGRSGLLTIFYGKPGSEDFYTAYWGTHVVPIQTFNLDHNSGTIDGVIRLPSGTKLKVTRRGRDNNTVRVNDRQVNPLFL